MERALSYGDPRGGPEAPRAPWFWLAVGAGVVSVGIAGNLLLAVLNPPPDLGDAPIVMDRRTGALYVRIDDAVHPVLNLTSAQLVAGSAADPQPVSGAAIAAAKHGASVGIPGAPQSIGTPLLEAETSWTVCDGRQTTLFVGPTPPIAEKQTVLVTGPTGTAYLLYDDKRAVVDVEDPAVRQALGLDGDAPIAVSAALLNTVPEVAPVVVPRIAEMGNPGPSALPGTAVGDVVRVERAGGAQHFVILSGGVQPVGEVAADLVRFGGTPANDDIPLVSPDAIRSVPELGTLAVSTYPDRRIATAPRRENVCATWAHGVVTVGAIDAVPLPGGHAPITLAQQDGAGPGLDAVYLPPGRSLYVRPEHGPATGVVVSDTGVRFGVDADAVRTLGLPRDAAPAPWSMVSVLPSGPMLSRAAALVVRDVPADPAPPG